MYPIHIHGTLDEDIIFGYGDDTDSEYIQMKNSNEKELLRNFKTFEYLQSNKYRKVLNELDTFEHYEALIIGHSLDKTDKTILKTILDVDKCRNIELLKRSDYQNEHDKYEAHFELHANLSRIFNSEKELREKVIPFSWSINFPEMSYNDLNIINERDEELYLKSPNVELR